MKRAITLGFFLAVSGLSAAEKPMEKLAMEGPATWTIAGKPYEVRSWFLGFRNPDGASGLYYVVEWNCPACKPLEVTEEHAKELTAPLFKQVCETKSWQRFSLPSGVHATNLAVQIVDRSYGGVYPHFGVTKKIAETCP